MHSNLARALLSRGVIRGGTVLHAVHHVRGLSCQCDAQVLAPFVVTRARLLSGQRVIFDALDAAQSPHLMAAEQVVSVDGMPLDRIAASHQLSLDGCELMRRSKRGRRSIQPSRCLSH